MSDPVPHNKNRLANWISRVTHPLVIFIPTLLVVLKDANPLEALAWITLIALIILSSAFILLGRARRQGRPTYQRETRHHIYATFWLSMLFCMVLGAVFDAPHRLVFSLLALCVWAPLQYLVNARLTKISVHVAVVSGIAAALILMGELDTIPLMAAAAAVVIATAWARIVTANHSLFQVGLGVVVSISSVLIAFAVISIWLPL